MLHLSSRFFPYITFHSSIRFVVNGCNFISLLAVATWRGFHFILNKNNWCDDVKNETGNKATRLAHVADVLLKIIYSVYNWVAETAPQGNKTSVEMSAVREKNVLAKNWWAKQKNAQKNNVWMRKKAAAPAPATE